MAKYLALSKNGSRCRGREAGSTGTTSGSDDGAAGGATAATPVPDTLVPDVFAAVVFAAGVRVVAGDVSVVGVFAGSGPGRCRRTGSNAEGWGVGGIRIRLGRPL